MENIVYYNHDHDDDANSYIQGQCLPFEHLFVISVELLGGLVSNSLVYQLLICCSMINWAF